MNHTQVKPTHVKNGQHRPRARRVSLFVQENGGASIFSDEFFAAMKEYYEQEKKAKQIAEEHKAVERQVIQLKPKQGEQP
jgi:hypothetical protein